MSSLTSLKEMIDRVDEELLQLAYKRGELVKTIKLNHGVVIDPLFKKMVQLMKSDQDEQNVQTINNLISEFIHSDKKVNQNEKKQQKTMLYSREYQKEDTIVTIKGEKIGDGQPHFIMGPCAVESYQQVSEVAEKLVQKGIRLLRGGAFKPRTSPYDFQGLGVEGLEILSRVAREKNMAVITEIMSEEQIEDALPYVDVIQVGARNMHNYSLLKALGRTDKPILLKRGLTATIEEFKFAAEYILIEGNKNVILCERGIRTYETATRNTLDISAVPILKQETHLPVVVDVTHSTGRKDLLTSISKASLAVGADGIMAEVHPNPALALSDSKQQMNFHEFDTFFQDIQQYLSNYKSEPILI